MISHQVVQQIESLLSEGVPKLQVVKRLGVSRTTVEKVSARVHTHQQPSADQIKLYRQERDRRRNDPHAHSPDVVRAVEQLLEAGVPKSQVRVRLGIGKRTVMAVARGLHLRQSPTPEHREKVKREREALRFQPVNLRSAERVREVELLLDEGLALERVRKATGVGRRFAAKVRARRHYHQLSDLQQRLRMGHVAPAVHRISEYRPTPQQIAEACLEIQATWSPEERAARAAGYDYWTPQLCLVRVA